MNAKILTSALGVAKHLGQSCDIFKARIEPLPGNRMHRMGSIADKSNPSGNHAMGCGQRQRVDIPRACQRNLTKKIAKPWAQDAEIILITQVVNVSRDLSLFGPDNATAILR